MAVILPEARMSFAEYVSNEKTSAVRHEFVGGEVFAGRLGLTDESPEHGALTAAVSRELGVALRHKPCRVFSDLRIRILETDIATYPDVAVVCGKLETAVDDLRSVVNPTVLIEVMSESTEAYDRGAKAANYRTIPSLKEYVLLAQDEPRIEVYRRSERGSWELFEARSGQSLELQSIGVTLSVDAVYENSLAAD